MIDLTKIFLNKGFIEESAISSRTKNIPPHKKFESALPKGKALERQIWRLFFNMGLVISNGKKPELKIDLEADYGQGKSSQKTKQIDGFFIMRDRYAFVVECKDREQEVAKTSTSLITQYFNDWKALKKPINKRIKRLFRGSSLREPIHIIATRGYEWKKSDRDRLKKEGFIVLADAGITYLESCFTESKSSWFTFNQFLSFFRGNENDFGSGLKKEQKQYIGFRTRAAPGKDGIFETKDDVYAYTTSMKVIDLLKISTVAHKKAEDIDELGETTKNYYQRILKSSRLSGKNGIPKFIKEKEGPFINNLLINYRGTKNLEDIWTPFDQGQKRGGMLTFDVLSPGMFHIIDGQHRLFGYSPIIEEQGDESDFGKHELIITLFDKLEPQDEARNFLQINKNQKAIDSGLVLEVQLVFGAHGDDKEVIENLATSLVQALQSKATAFNEPSAIKQSESMKKIDHTGNTVEQGSLTIRGMVTTLVKSPLIQTSGEFESGYAFKDGFDKPDKFNNTFEYLYEIYSKYFDEIRKARPQLWVSSNSAGKTVSNKSRIAQNTPIGGFLLLLDLFIQRKSKPRKKILNTDVLNLIGKLTNKLSVMTNEDEEALFDGQTYGGSGPKQFYHQLLENFHPDLIDDDIQAQIDNSKKEFNKFTVSEVKAIKDKYEERISKINQTKDLSTRLWNVEEYIRDNINDVFKKIFGPGYWSERGERSFFDEEFKKIGKKKDMDIQKIAENALRARKQEIESYPGGVYTKKDGHEHMIMWLQWNHWKAMLVEIINKKITFQKNYGQDIFDNKNKDLEKIIQDLFYASLSKPASKCTSEEGLEWFDKLNGMRNIGAHPSKAFNLSDIEIDYFNKMEKKILIKIDNIKNFLVE
jgi:DGQHR domain-containing protein